MDAFVSKHSNFQKGSKLKLKFNNRTRHPDNQCPSLRPKIRSKPLNPPKSLSPPKECQCPTSNKSHSSSQTGTIILSLAVISSSVTHPRSKPIKNLPGMKTCLRTHRKLPLNRNNRQHQQWIFLLIMMFKHRHFRLNLSNFQTRSTSLMINHMRHPNKQLRKVKTLGLDLAILTLVIPSQSSQRRKRRLGLSELPISLRRSNRSVMTGTSRKCSLMRS